MPRVSDERLTEWFTTERVRPDGWICYKEASKRCHDGCAADAADMAADLRDARARLAALEPVARAAVRFAAHPDQPLGNKVDAAVDAMPEDVRKELEA